MADEESSCSELHQYAGPYQSLSPPPTVMSPADAGGGGRASPSLGSPPLLSPMSSSGGSPIIRRSAAPHNMRGTSPSLLSLLPPAVAALQHAATMSKGQRKTLEMHGPDMHLYYITPTNKDTHATNRRFSSLSLSPNMSPKSAMRRISLTASFGGSSARISSSSPDDDHAAAPPQHNTNVKTSSPPSATSPTSAMRRIMAHRSGGGDAASRGSSEAERATTTSAGRSSRSSGSESEIPSGSSSKSSASESDSRAKASAQSGSSSASVSPTNTTPLSPSGFLNKSFGSSTQAEATPRHPLDGHCVCYFHSPPRPLGLAFMDPSSPVFLLGNSSPLKALDVRGGPSHHTAHANRRRISARALHRDGSMANVHANPKNNALAAPPPPAAATSGCSSRWCCAAAPPTQLVMM